MEKYLLNKGDELVEVLEGREERRDRLMAAGYTWINAPSTLLSVAGQAHSASSGQAPQGQATLKNKTQPSLQVVMEEGEDDKEEAEDDR